MQSFSIITKLIEENFNYEAKVIVNFKESEITDKDYEMYYKIIKE